MLTAGCVRKTLSAAFEKLFSRTTLGKAMLATAHDKLAAQLIGVNTKMVLLLSFVLAAMLGAVGGMVFSKYIGAVLEDLGTYTPIFVIAASAYLFALLVIHLLAPRLEPANLEGAPGRG